MTEELLFTIFVLRRQKNWTSTQEWCVTCLGDTIVTEIVERREKSAGGGDVAGGEVLAIRGVFHSAN